MTWQDIRAAYPDHWVLVKVHQHWIETPEHLKAKNKGPYTYLTRFEVIADFEDETDAQKAGQELRGQPDSHHNRLMHTSLEEIEVIEHDDHWWFPMVGCMCIEVSYKRYNIELKFEKHDDRFSFDPIFQAMITIETALDDATKARMIGLVGQTVASAVATHTDELVIAFEEGGDLRVPPDPNFESWQVSGSFGILVVSLPGGGLAVW